jgi:hypothetical protein
MKTLTFFGCDRKLTKSHKLVTQRGQPPYYVRTKLSSRSDVDALSNAKPLPQETVLNTVTMQP